MFLISLGLKRVMPNRKAHLATAIIVGLIAGLLLYGDLSTALMFMCLSGVTASLPDNSFLGIRIVSAW